jgi:MFS family permease
MIQGNSDTIWSRSFIILCVAEFLGYANHALLIPTLPLYVSQMGNSPFMVGVVLASFSIFSVLLRPTIGTWADSWSYGGVLTIGALITGLSVLLFFFPVTAMLIAANATRGVGWAALNTGGYSLLAHSAPDRRRGEAAGYYSGFQNGAHIVFPALGLWLIEAPWGSFHRVIALAASVGLMGSMMGFYLKRLTERATPKTQPATGARQGRPGSIAVVNPKIVLVAALLFCLHISMPVAAGFLPLYAKSVGIEGVGWYFVASGLTQVLARPFLGLVSDRIGRGLSVVMAFVLELIGLCVLMIAPNLMILLVGGVFFATGIAMGTSCTTAIAITLAEPRHRGVTMATFSTAYPLSMGLGAILIGSAITMGGFPWMFVVAIMAGTLGLTMTLLCWSRLDRMSPTT